MLSSEKKSVKELLEVSGTNLPDELFATWWVKACLLSLSHIRDIKMYPAKPEYGFSKLAAS